MTKIDYIRETLISLQIEVSEFSNNQKQHPEMIKLINGLFQARSAAENILATHIKVTK